MLVRTFLASLLGMTASGLTPAQPQQPASQQPAPQQPAPQQPASQQPAQPQPDTGTEVGIAPFSAHYGAEWNGMTVGASDLQLRVDAEPGHYVYKWTITAHGIFRLVYSDALIQQSWFVVSDNHVRPQKYLAEEGSSSVRLDFDWDTGHARGRSEDKPVDIVLQSGAQDLMSIQIEVMLDLKNQNLPHQFHIVDKDKLKAFIYTQEGTASLRTALGQLDTIIVSSQQTGNNRILRMWFAPSLGFVPVQAERSRDGKLEFAMRIKTLNR
jgi:Protein of unknown function (DUF3108)